MTAVLVRPLHTHNNASVFANSAALCVERDAAAAAAAAGLM